MTWWDQTQIRHVTSNTSIDPNLLPVSAELFGPSEGFTIFGTDLTAHVYSDMSLGCNEGCYFCSENRYMSGKLNSAKLAPNRLFQQIKKTFLKAGHTQPEKSLSFFCDDSKFLSSSPTLINEFGIQLANFGTQVNFGGQFTVSDIASKRLNPSITFLTSLGLSYVYCGIETLNDEVAQSFSKYKKKSSWIDENLKTIDFLTSLNINYGVAMIFGIGESSEDRIRQLETILRWQQTYSNPKVVSINWAVQHPMRGHKEIDYLDWGTDANSEYLPYFQNSFGEASEKYRIDGTELPSLQELSEIEDLFRQLSLKNRFKNQS